jgi:CheY-like chemotaxis protein
LAVADFFYKFNPGIRIGEPMKPLNVLLADDDSDDCAFFEEALSAISPGFSMIVKRDGQEVLEYLFHPHAVLPDIIFLDLNMPLIDGAKCLEEIRKNKNMDDIFIVMNTTTASWNEIDRSYNNGANLFLIKPNSFQELKQSIETIINLDFKHLMLNRRRDRFVVSQCTFSKNVL